MADNRFFPREQKLVGLAFLLGAIHAVDETFINEEVDAVPPIGVAIELAVLVILGVVWPRLGLWWRVGVSLLLGVGMVVGGVFGHLVHFVSGGASGADYTGIPFTAGGVILLVVAALLVARRRTSQEYAVLQSPP